mgnify:CR=1 FL=1
MIGIMTVLKSINVQLLQAQVESVRTELKIKIKSVTHTSDYIIYEMDRTTYMGFNI